MFSEILPNCRGSEWFLSLPGLGAGDPDLFYYLQLDFVLKYLVSISRLGLGLKGAQSQGCNSGL